METIRKMRTQYQTSKRKGIEMLHPPSRTDELTSKTVVPITEIAK